MQNAESMGVRSKLTGATIGFGTEHRGGLRTIGCSSLKDAAVNRSAVEKPQQ